MGMAAAAGIGAVGSVAGGLIQSGAASSAAKTQSAAANNAANLQFIESQQSNQLIQSIYKQNVERLQPFVGAGVNALGSLASMTGMTAGGNPATSPLTKPFAPTMEQLAQTPGYQFALQQGTLATQAGASAIGQGSAVAGVGAGQPRGVGPSGPLGKGLANYAEGLASTTYQQQFQNDLATKMQVYNMLAGQVGIGANAAAQTGQMGTTAGGQSANALMGGASAGGSYLTAGAAANAAGQVGSASALSNGLTGVGNSALLYGMFGGQGGGQGLASSVMNMSASNPIWGG